jgi:rhombotail lipoprotein
MPRLDKEVMQLPFTIPLLLAMALSAGCAGSQGFNRAAMNEVLHVDPSSDRESHAPSNQSYPLSPPFRLGIFFADHNFPNHQSLRKVEWLSADRERLLHGLAPLRDQQILTDIFVLMDSTVQAENIDGIRQAGSRYGADGVLIVDGAGAIDRYNNRFAWLYPTMIGAYLAPGTESDALVMATGSLWAVRSEWHAPIHIVEGVSKITGSAVFVEDSAALQEAKKQAIQVLGRRIVHQLQLWMQGFPPPLSQLR